MKHHLRLAALAGIIIGAAAAAGCDRDTGGIATGPAAAPAAPHTAPPQRPGGPGATAINGGGDTGTQIGDATSPFRWTDADGHVYTVLFGTAANGTLGSVSHYRDGALFAVENNLAGGTSVDLYSGGLLLQNTFISAGGPSGVRGLDSDFLTTPPPLQPDSSRPVGPQRAMMIPCASELTGYFYSATAMIGAAWVLQRNPTNNKLRMAFATTVTAFIGAWKDLYDCQTRNSWGG